MRTAAISAIAGLALTAGSAAAAPAAPITDFNGLEVGVSWGSYFGNGLGVTFGAPLGSDTAIIGDGTEFTGITVGDGIDITPDPTFDLDITPGGLVELTSPAGGTLINELLFLFRLEFDVAVTGVMTVDDLLIEGFVPNAIIDPPFVELILRGGVVNDGSLSIAILQPPAGTVASWQLTADAAVPLPPGLALLLTGLGVMVFAAGRSA